MDGTIHDGVVRLWSTGRLLSLPIATRTVVVAGLIAMGSASTFAEENLATSRPKRVLIVESYGRDTAPWNVITPAFKNELVRQFQAPVEFYETGPESAREADAQSDLVFTAYLRALYAEHPPDLVLPVGAAATSFWWRHRQSLFPSAPVVIGGIEQRMLQNLSLGANDTAVSMRIDITSSGFDPIFELFPDTTTIAMVIGNSRMERYWSFECQEAWRSYHHRGQLVSFNTLSFPEICRRAAALPGGSVLAYWIFWVDAAGVPHEQMKALDEICALANAPVFGLFEEQLGHGIVGGRLISSESIGREAARLAARVLGGEPAGKIPPVMLSAGRPMFDWRQLQRWNIDERRLPPGSIVQFRPPSAWGQYRWYILGAGMIILTQTATIVGLLRHRTKRRSAEAAALRISGRLITAQEEERRRIARDLHDDLNQRLALLSVELDVARHAEAQSPLAPQLGEMARQVKDLSSEVHRLSYQLHPAKLDQLGLATTARSFCLEYSSQSGIPITFTDRNVPRELSADVALAVFRVLQESLGNTLRHGKATKARVDLRLDRHHLHLTVSDNGTGFDRDRPRSNDGLGLVSMEERARLVHGQLTIRTAPGRGTTVEFSVPIEPAPNPPKGDL